MLMQAHTDALPRPAKRADRPSRQTTQRSDQDRREIRESDKLTIGRDVFAFYNHPGAIVVASAWLAIYLIAAIPPFVTWSLSFIK
jgi:hypothetical protein